MDALLDVAIVENWPSTLQYLLDVRVGKSTFRDHCLAGQLLRAATTLRDSAMMQDLLPIISCEENNDTTRALFAAIRAENHEAAELLFPYVKDFDARNRQGQTLLHVALYQKSETIIRLLLPGSTCLFHPGLHENSTSCPLTTAARQQPHAVVAMLLERMDELLSQSVRSMRRALQELCEICRSGLLPGLQLALAEVQHCDLETAWLLIALVKKYRLQHKGFYHALSSFINKSSPVMDAISKGYLAVAKAMIDYQYRGLVDVFLRHGADIRPEKKRVYPSVLMIAAEAKHGGEMAQLLIDRGADLEHVDEQGRTALSFAVARGNAEVAKVLVAAGCDTLKPDQDGKTPYSGRRMI
ncbi:ankyrin repeat-containing domain protein [Aspergillus crustosus]